MPGNPAAALRSGKPEQVGTDLGTVLAHALKGHGNSLRMVLESGPLWLSPGLLPSILSRLDSSV